MFLRTACMVLPSPGLLAHWRLTAQTLKNVTCTLTRTHASQRYLTCCCCFVGSTLAHLGGQQPEPSSTHLRHNRDSCGFNLGPLQRVCVSAESIGQQLGGRLSRVLRRHEGRADTVALLAGNTRLLATMAASRASSASSKKTTDGDNIAEDQKTDPSTHWSAGKAPGESEPDGDKPNKTQQLKKVFQEYGAVGVSFHIGISLMSLGMFYLLISSGIDMAAVLSKVGFSEAIIQSKMAAGTSTFVLAYAIHKLFAPVRISITLVSVPLIVRYFRRTGLFKPPTSAP
ncbi:protein FAM210B, mitochondrial [Dunckerocampus dactyliophorus]|uniref:protein FAM210B, mitochondrial n=1 Tax=Dunckerocampus dactyliophorus TaxID=161453 RepID=UPI0024049E7A|nr:protein FAM210B, mitochondrial [Dunckerocampus dactyliophorus]